MKQWKGVEARGVGEEEDAFLYTIETVSQLMWYLSRPEWNESVNPAVIRVKNIPEWENRKHKIPETGECLMCLRDREEVNESRTGVRG